MSDAVAAEESGPTADEGGEDDGYSGFLSAYWYAFRRTDSYLCKSYVLASVLAVAFVSVLLLLTLVTWFVATLGQSALTTSSNAFLGVIAIAILAPLVAPVMFVARTHRRGGRAGRRRDAALALAGYLFVASLYVGLVISIPEGDLQPETGSAVVAFLYSLPQLFGLVPPLLAALVILLVHRATR